MEISFLHSDTQKVVEMPYFFHVNFRDGVWKYKHNGNERRRTSEVCPEYAANWQSGEKERFMCTSK